MSDIVTELFPALALKQEGLAGHWVTINGNHVFITEGGAEGTAHGGAVEYDDESQSAKINVPIESNGEAPSKPIRARAYTAQYWESPDGSKQRVYLNVENEDITHQLHKGEWDTFRGADYRKAWAGEKPLPMGYFDRNPEGKLLYHVDRMSGNGIGGKAFQQEHLKDVVNELFRRHRK